ncbi:MAG: tryptophan--tRNA ligase [Candidatus Sungbacteria bacterium RIFCSPLOWO2_01_FULL_47_10]|uniref:Tryptophan--tRNA ligase n=1 Tax=Candidatus Sungbacteria bacterium RIFCSPLOWO2_01_FULL_47_10 TaxID=1802276 RepID=A0A1G2L5S6_9BACT|nr:MAG: tryptophan--tRNA ligase [Candidatus Sungbacteria bacterium RIFCSPLOWO2_01_FULL_47_10]
MTRQRIFSGIQPSGNLHIGNYLGAIQQFVGLQETTDAIFCIVDLHAITVPQDPEELRKKTLEVAMIYLACGIDPKKSIMFVQSHNHDHAELAWILNTLTPLGELERMTQFKEKRQSAEKRRGVLSGLLNYPTLMAADILLYQTDVVPVGEDQKQHVELTRSIAERFNNRFGDTFMLPKEMLNKSAERIMGLDDPSKKMSKSAKSANNYIALLDSPDEILRKIKTAMTDSGSEIRFDKKAKSAVSNLLAVYHAFSKESIKNLENRYAGKGYAEFKKDLGEIIIAKLEPIQNRFRELEKNSDEVMKIIREGAERSGAISQKTLSEVKQKIGLIA